MTDNIINWIQRNPEWLYAGVYAEMLTTTLIQMHPTCTQTAPYLHPEPKAGCICRIFVVVNENWTRKGAILDRGSIILNRRAIERGQEKTE